MRSRTMRSKLSHKQAYLLAAPGESRVFPRDNRPPCRRVDARLCAPLTLAVGPTRWYSSGFSPTSLPDQLITQETISRANYELFVRFDSSRARPITKSVEMKQTIARSIRTSVTRKSLRRKTPACGHRALPQDVRFDAIEVVRCRVPVAVDDVMAAWSHQHAAGLLTETV